MTQVCPRCQSTNPAAARFCAQCGLVLDAALAGAAVAGRIKHPDPVATPEGFELIDNAVDLYVRWGSAWGGERLLGTENLAGRLFNAGYSLREIVVRVYGEDQSAEQTFSIDKTIEALPRGGEETIEIASWEMPSPAKRVSAALVSAEFAEAE